MNSNNIKFSAMDIANYIIWYVNKKELGGVTPLKLQKILYYVSAAYLQKTNETLFNEKFQKWQYGPVVKEVYHEFKSHGIYNINKPKDTLETCAEAVFGIKRVKFDSSKFTSETIFTDIANPVIDRLSSFRAFDLVEMTHRELSWKNFESDIMNGCKELIYTENELRSAKSIT